MEAAWIENGKVSVTEKPDPEPLEDEVLLRPLLTGICRTDAELLQGYHGFRGIPGHEVAGVVCDANGHPRWQDARVVVEINKGCGKCSQCRRHGPRHCPSRKVLGIRDWPGAFARYMTAPVSNLHRIPDSLSLEEAVFTEPLAAALRITQQLHLPSSHRALVLGDGKLGLLAALALRFFVPRLVLAGKHPEKLRIAGDQDVTTYWVEPDRENRLVAELGRFDVVVEATGRETGILTALECVRPQGTLVLKTTSHRPSTLPLARAVVDEIHIVGSRCGDFRPALVFLENRWVNVHPLVEAVYPLEGFPDALEHARRPGALKVLVRMD